MGGAHVQLHTFLTLALGGGERSTSRLDRLVLRKETRRRRWRADRVCSRARLDVSEIRKIPVPCPKWAPVSSTPQPSHYSDWANTGFKNFDLRAGCKWLSDVELLQITARPSKCCGASSVREYSIGHGPRIKKRGHFSWHHFTCLFYKHTESYVVFGQFTWSHLKVWSTRIRKEIYIFHKHCVWKTEISKKFIAL